MSLGLAATISAAGISAPSYADILSKLQTAIKGIYGLDIYIAADSKDGQLLALFAQAVSDCNDVAIGVYAQFSPATAVGAGLASNVKLNGLQKLAASYSSAPGLVVGQVGATITNGVVKDANGNLWNLPASVTIPGAGQISVTVTAQQIGAITAPSGTINQIVTPSLGWQTFASTSDAAPGAPVESDPALRGRQASSTSQGALTTLAAVQGALGNLTGVTKVAVYENDSKTTDANGVPANSICAVVEGGSLSAIAQIIGQKKAPGSNTYGTTSQGYTDPTTGIPYTINFFVLAFQNLKVRITGTALTGYSSGNVAAIQNAISAYMGLHIIGQDVERSGLWGPAYQNLPALQQTYKVTNVELSTDGGTTWVTTDIVIPFNVLVQTAPTDVTVTIS